MAGMLDGEIRVGKKPSDSETILESLRGRRALAVSFMYALKH